MKMLRKNANVQKKRQLDLRTRLRQVIMFDREVEGGLSQLGSYVKNGKFFYNCVKSADGLWWI